MNPSDVYHELKQNSDAVLIDVRQGFEFKAQRAEMAQSYPLSAFPDNFLAEHTNKDQRIFVICASGGRSDVATTMLKPLGYTNVENVDGGTMAWVEQKLPVVGTMVASNTL